MTVRTTTIALTAVLISLGLSTTAQGHCQIPCGIYDDDARISAMLEDVKTIEKATKAINELAEKNDADSVNQKIRWTTAKEEHASRIIEVISTYYLTQKIKPVSEDGKERDAYLSRLEHAHKVMKAAMKTKQSASTDNAKTLHTAIDSFAASMK